VTLLYAAAGIKLAKVLKGLVEYGPVVNGLGEKIKELIKSTGTDSQKVEIDKIQTQMMEKIAEQNIHMTEALTLIYTKMKYLTVLSIISLVIGVSALVIILFKQ